MQMLESMERVKVGNRMTASTSCIKVFQVRSGSDGCYRKAMKKLSSWSSTKKEAEM